MSGSRIVRSNLRPVVRQVDGPDAILVKKELFRPRCNRRDSAQRQKQKPTSPLRRLFLAFSANSCPMETIRNSDVADVRRSLQSEPIKLCSLSALLPGVRHSRNENVVAARGVAQSLSGTSERVQSPTKKRDTGRRIVFKGKQKSLCFGSSHSTFALHKIKLPRIVS